MKKAPMKNFIRIWLITRHVLSYLKMQEESAVLLGWKSAKGAHSIVQGVQLACFEQISLPPTSLAV